MSYNFVQDKEKYIANEYTKDLVILYDNAINLLNLIGRFSSEGEETTVSRYESIEKKYGEDKLNKIKEIQKTLKDFEEVMSDEKWFVHSFTNINDEELVKAAEHWKNKLNKIISGLVSDTTLSTIINIGYVNKNENLLKELYNKQNELTKLLENNSLERFGKGYSNRIEELWGSERKWLYSIIAIGFISFVYAIAIASGAGNTDIDSFFESKNFYFIEPQDSDTTLVVFLEYLTASLPFSILFYLLYFATKNYRSTRHIRLIFVQKETQLSTYTAFIASGAGEEERKGLTIDLGRRLFTIEKTGLINEEDPKIDASGNIIGSAKEFLSSGD